ncbi:enoyl-CoA hydratase domain-containing protein 3, mitochondrial isoform X2 [Nilaparvata lugens]|uniref:enoyl-CoA hydratase domain-containing protein 3, mitochondrial isoform X2 n=1 Tax=Nilaparvata lugens TaxID=108931 RepID=UPI00193D7682|nr:enoyl-CoA hydratase domain-containing protein 3, mitochondrial isoform X2 [Nilaparvata lugens]
MDKESQTASQSMEYNVCGKIAEIVVNRLEDISTSRPQIKVQIKIEKKEDEFGEYEFATSNVKDEPSSHNGSTSNQIPRITNRFYSCQKTGKLTKLSEDNGVRKIVMANPKTRNALSVDMMEDLIDDVSLNWCDTNLRCIVISGEGPVFSSGHNLKELALTGEKDELAEKRRVFSICAQLMKRIVAAPVPVIASVNGPAFAAGCQLVAQCDIALATHSSSFATPGSHFGIFCSTPGIPLARAVPRKVAAHMLFTGKPITAEQAASYGLISKVVADDKLDEEIEAVCASIKSQSRSIIELGKRFFYQQLELDLNSAYQLGTDVMTNNTKMADGQEGIAGFAQKRKPVWKHNFDEISSA